MFEEWKSSEKTSLFVVVALNLPIEIAVPEYESKTWSYDVLQNLATDLDVSESYIDAYLPMVLKSQFFSQEWEDRLELIQPFLNNLANFDRSKMYVHTLMFLIVNSLFISIEVDLAKSLLDHQKELSHQTDEKTRKGKFMRYAKIGAVAVGAGAVLAVTGGLAAPAIAGAFLVMGSSSVAAAASAVTVATVFGSAGAGLTGYKMMKRTKGLQEFEFEQYDGQGQLAVMIMVSGWLKSADDYKRSFGILCNELTMRERLSRYYQVHCPERLQTIDEEIEIYQDDPNRLYSKLERVYGASPLDAGALLPPIPEIESAAELLLFIEQCIQGVATIKPEAELPQYAEVGPAQPQSADSAGSSPSTAVSDKAADPVQEPHTSTSPQPHSEGVEMQEQLQEEGKGEVEVEVVEDLVNLFDNHHWNWRELDISALYELYLLRWEVKMQQDLGNSIIDMLKNLSSAAVQNVLAYTVFTALASAVMWPVLILKLTDMIDPLWTIAIERADQAGKELAKVLSRRPQGSRPVTLVGFSLGSRVIFSCLRELAKLLDEAVEREGGVSALASPAKSGRSARVMSAEKKVASVSSSEDGRISDDEADNSSDEGSLFDGEDAAAANQKDTGRRYFFSRRKESKPAAKTNADEAPVLSSKEIRGMVADVVLLGAPISLTSHNWSAVRQVVAGRLINGYSTKDKVLGIIYRYQRFKFSVCGIAPVTSVAGIENVDLSSLVEQHVDYGRKMKEILQRLDLTSRGAHLSEGCE